MRRRLLFSTVAVAVTAVVLFGLPLALVLIHLQINAARAQVKRDATTVANTLQNRLDAGLSADFTPVVQAVAKSLPDRYVSIKYDHERPVTYGDRLKPSSAVTAHDNTRNFQVTVQAAMSVEGEGVTEALGLTGSLALLALGVAVGLAIFQTRRLSRPLVELATAADRLGTGGARPLGRRYGIPELDRVAEGLDGSAQRIRELLAAEREFAADASHQLRTPLTALSMRLEEMLAAADEPAVVREEGAAALLQAERLTEVVTQLLGRTRLSTGSTPQPVAIDDVVAQQVVEWDPAFRAQNRKLELAGEKNLVAYASVGTPAQAVATLLENALVHGTGSVTIRTSQTPKSVVIEVRNEGRGVPPELVPRIFERSVSGRPGGTGLGLALARSIVTADGGQVVLVRPRPAAFAIFLPSGLPGGGEEAPVVSGPP